jgi:tetratricopeptide (TPR) repeat protein
MIWDRVVKYLCLATVGLMFAGCASGRKVVEPPPEAELLVPAGVDSAVAVESDTLAKRLFVPLADEEKAEELKATGQEYIQQSDSLWRYLTMKPGEKQVSAEDSLEAVRKYNEGASALIEYSEISPEAATDSLEIEQLKERQKFLLDRAQEALEQAIVRNPFDLEARDLLSTVYQLQAVRLSQTEKFAEAAKILERLTRLDRGQHALYARLGQLYYAMKQWQAAYDNFKKAEDVLLATAYLNAPEDSPDLERAPVDTTAWFTYAFYEGYSQTNMRRAEAALDHLLQALALARSPEQRKTVQSVIDWINWDDGNILASEKRDEVLEKVAAEQFGEAEVGFRDLLGRLRTQRARDEVEWRLALVEYQLDKKEQAIARLRQVVDRLSAVADSAKVDSLTRRYFEDYGTMAFNLGGWYHKEKRSRRVAFTYFNQASKVPWSGRAKAFVELAKFSQNDPVTAIRYGEEAVARAEQLNPREQKELYALLSEMYKRIGQFDEARRYYRLWTQK